MDGDRLDLAAMIVWPAVAAAISLQLSVNMIESIALFLVVPSLYLAYRLPGHVRKVAVFSAFISVPTVIVLDSIAEAVGTWYIYSMFPWKLYGLVSIEAFLWGFFTAFYIVMFHLRFIASDPDGTVWDGRKDSITRVVYGLLLVYTIGFFFVPETFTFPYFYLLFGVLIILGPLTYQFLRKPEMVPDLVQTGVYFFYAFLIYEITALTIEFWGFPAHATTFVGWVEMAGARFPLDEFVFFLQLTAPVTVVFYDLWQDGF